MFYGVVFQCLFLHRSTMEDCVLISKRILPGERLADDVMDETLEIFHRDGFALIPGVLTRDEIDALREATDRCFNDPVLAGTDYVSGRGDGFVW